MIGWPSDLSLRAINCFTAIFTPNAWFIAGDILIYEIRRVLYIKRYGCSDRIPLNSDIGVNVSVDLFLIMICVSCHGF